MLNNKFLFSYFISVVDTSALHVRVVDTSNLHLICFFIKINKILKIIKILNDFYNSVIFSSSFIRSKELRSTVSLILSFILS